MFELGPYRLVARLGATSTGEIWRAVHLGRRPRSGDSLLGSPCRNRAGLGRSEGVLGREPLGTQ